MIQSISNGRPTKPQVEKLFLRVKDMKDGDLISHEQIAGLIGEAKNSFRYRTIVGVAQRRIFRELGCRLLSEHGVGYRRGTGREELKAVASGIGRHVRGFGRQLRYGAAIADERLDEQDRRVRNHILERGSYLYEIAKAQNKDISLTLGKPELLPK